MSTESLLPTVLRETAEPDIARLKAYLKLKQAIARQVRALRQLYAKREDEAAVSTCHELIVKLAEDRFTLAVLGQFKSGKSSLMNAILGKDVLPTGVLPLTSAITVLRYGPEERLVILRDNDPFPEIVTVDHLEDFVTEKGNPGNRRRVKTARLEMPIPFLRYGLEFVDTPGVGSAIEANTTTTYDFLPKCDAVLFVTSVDAPLGKAEMELITNVHPHVRRIFFVVNKTDLLRQDEQTEVLQFMSESLKALPLSGSTMVFPVSARTGLEAKLKGDTEAYEHSGLKSLEETLASFLANEKSSAFLGATVDRASRLVDMARTDGQGNSVWETERLSQVEGALAGLKKLVRADLTKENTVETPPEEAFVETIAQEKPVADTAPTPATIPLWTRGCPVCRRMEKHAFDFFATWQYALASEAAAQAAFAADLGCCPVHTWQLVAISSPQGLSMAYPMLLERISRELTLSASSPDPAMPAVTFGSVKCRVCEELQIVQQRALMQLAEYLADESGRRTFDASQGVCLRHLDGLLKLLPEPALRSELMLCAARRMEEWSEEMQNYAMKREAIRSELLNNNEQDAYLRAIIHQVGAKTVCAP